MSAGFPLQVYRRMVARTDGVLGDAIRLVASRSLIGSVSPYVRSQPVRRYYIDRATYAAKARATVAKIERKLMSSSVRARAASSGALHGAFRGELAEAEADLEAELAAARERLAAAGSYDFNDLNRMAEQAGYKAYGETVGRLGLPLSRGSFDYNAAYTRIRREAEDLLPTEIRDLATRLEEPSAFAGAFLSDAESMVRSRIGGTFNQGLGMMRVIRDGMDSAGMNLSQMASAFAGSVEAGGLSIVQDAMELRPDWLTNELGSTVFRSLTSIAGAAASGDLSRLFSSFGSAVMSVGPCTGPAAPFVQAAGGLMMLGSMIANLFTSPDVVPTARPFRVCGEQWGTFKLMYAAAVPSSVMTALRDVAAEEIRRVFPDPNTGEVMVHPHHEWTSNGRLSAAAGWPSALRMVDLFDRRALNDPGILDWIKTGRGIMFDGAEDTPADLWSMVLNTDPYVKFAGAMSCSPAPYATGGGPSAGGSHPSQLWPVGPAVVWSSETVDWQKAYWKRSVYRAAYVAAAALGGCPPFASYGSLGPENWASGGSFHCTGVGGRKDADVPGRGTIRWIPWCSYYCELPPSYFSDRRIREEWGHEPIRGWWLIPPRRVPFHLQGKTGSDFDPEFGKWLRTGAMIASHIDMEKDHEIVVSGAPPTSYSTRFGGDEAWRVGLVGNPLERAMTLDGFFRRWYDRPYDENEPRTWFIKQTPSVVRPGTDTIMHMRSAVARPPAPGDSGGGGGGVPTVAVVGGLTLAALLAYLALS